ncbi:30S ribosomal protein S3ae [Halogeometricum borinquense]|uniref:Small ribosomal subunit protein eS1 n=2 Tax=Halogeometricum borinquense TaxID=60847 RepID=E4NPJ0_HALBP|nr:30S ribosomal protein S3ae [Halogeometricum borinquense]ADQ67660.1 SSU ribosomal protein S3AE [Halogeometricum borinquense DSM 11551]ELY23659.1 30S ribosomal protein S3Ae [Halogeometricum borinquense DSM 11551]QIB73751.1 30S ribosomal protein S3ae [Halogeometricum borinquense]QIQ76891.1 30S ribosomal protein S3ae [Halogeometricum borinquense]RYJ13393.1 30S ribosomal protein S3ae [Halogeometricum borinquense]
MSERSVSKQKRGKRWYTLIAPEQFDREELGETMADEPEKVDGRTIEVTLGDLTGDQGANNTKLTFKVNDVSSDSAYTEFIKHELARDYLRSLVRRGASKISASITVLTKDDYRVQIQPVAFTTKKADRSQEQAIRRVMIDFVEEAAQERTFEELVDSAVVDGRLSSAIYGEAKTIYPLRRVEVQKLTLEARPEEVAAEEEAAVDVDEEDIAVDEA